MEFTKIPVYFGNEADAKIKARDTLIKIFESKLLNIDTIKGTITEFQKYDNQNSIEVFNTIERNINECQVFIKKFGDIYSNMDELHNEIQNIFKEWQRITYPINHYSKKLEDLMLSKKNVSVVVQNLNIYIRIKDQIKELRDFMEANDANVVTVFKQMRYLVYLRRVLLDKVKSVNWDEKLNNLGDHLLCVQQFEDEFFNKFWKYFDNMLDISQKKPEFLVKLLRIIEEDPDYMRNIRSQFSIYTKNDERYQGLDKIRASSVMNDSVRESNLEKDDELLSDVLIFKLEEQINEKFHRKFLDKKELNEKLDASIELAQDLRIIYTNVSPCFPSKYKIFEFHKNIYIKLIHFKLKPILNEEYLKQTPGNLILLANFLDKFDDILKFVGCDIKATELGSEVKYYMSLYYDYVHDLLSQNIQSILEKNLEDKNNLKLSKNKDLNNLDSLYATDLFKNILYVIDVLSEFVKGSILHQVISVVIQKIQEIQLTNDKYLEKLKDDDDLIVSCVYILDAHFCIKLFPDFKKKIKNMMQKEYYERLKEPLKRLVNNFNSTIKLGCNKATEIMFNQFEICLSNMFSQNWNDNVLNEIFNIFKNNFDTGFSKILKEPHIHVILIRTFIDNFCYYYFEELIHSIRSANRKKLTDSELNRYRFKYIKCKLNLVEKHNENKKVEEKKIQGVIDVKVLGTEKGKEVKKKYQFPVKLLEKSWKMDVYNTTDIYKRIESDKNIFTIFLESFKEGSKDPFSKYFSQTLGNTYITNNINKFIAILDILKCGNNSLKDSIVYLYKESFRGLEGKVLLESLLYIREDYKQCTKPDFKKFYLTLYDSN